MKPKIIFTDNYTLNNKLVDDEYDYYVLTKNAWNDGGYCTTFEVKLLKNKQFYSQQNRKILFDGQTKEEESYRFLTSLYNSDNYVNIEDVKKVRQFISIGTDYDAIKEVFNDYYDEILECLHDVQYLKLNNKMSDELSKITGHEAFNISLLREQAYKKYYNDFELEIVNKGKSDEDKEKLEPEFNFNLSLGIRNYKYNFKFFDKYDLPARINLLIGKNGTGKSQTLKYIANYFMFQEREQNVDVDKHPNFILNLIVFAYNPYEDFYIPKENEGILIKHKYVGFKKRIKNEKIKYHPNHPKEQSFESFVNLILKDIDNFDTEREKVYDVSFLQQVINFLHEARNSITWVALKPLKPETIDYCRNINIDISSDQTYIVLEPEKMANNSYKIIKDLLKTDFDNEVYFVDTNKKIIPFSSGQKIFSYLIINLLSMIKRNSLVLIDEPETALHPNLEIHFMRILNSILEKHDSYAIIASHSSIITREIPDKFVHIISVNNNETVSIDKPVMKTFGSNIGDITNYIFDDLFQEEKPFEKWIIEQKDKYQDYNEFKEKVGKFLSYEVLHEAKKVWEL